MPHWLADAVTIRIARRAGISRHRRARHARHQNGGDRQKLEPCSHRYLRKGCEGAPERSFRGANATLPNRASRVVEPGMGTSALLLRGGGQRLCGGRGRPMRLEERAHVAQRELDLLWVRV